MSHSQQVTAVSYIRVSGRGQLRGDGFERQRISIARFAKANGHRLVDEFRDEGVSGTRELDDRPGLAALLDRVEHNHVKTVLVENASRLARDLMVQEVGFAMLKSRGIDLIAADSPASFLDDTPTARLIRQVLGAISEFEKAMLVAKLRVRVTASAELV